MLCLLKDFYPNNEIEAVSVKFSDSNDESQIASKIAKRLDVSHNIIEIPNYLSSLPKAISITKLPFWDIHWIYVIEKAKTLSNYLVSGDGGDELFGGYVFRYSKFLSLVNQNSTSIEKIKAYLSCHERDHVVDQHKIFHQNLCFSWNDINQILTPYFENHLTPLEQVFLADYNGKLLYNFSIINSRLTKFHGITSVTPLLSFDLIKKAMKLKLEDKFDIKSNSGKLPLKILLKNYEIDDLISKEKLGFSVDTKNLWVKHGKKLAEEILLDGQIINEGLINRDWIELYIDRGDLDVRYVNKFLGLIALELWHQIVITKSTSPDNFS